jgi:pimeloyl-ACP methyl ester carboxylesterase
LPDEARAAFRTDRLASDPVGLANSLRGMGTGAQEPLHDRLASLAMPALVMAGELDTRYVATGREMVAAMPNSRFVEVPGAGHAAHTENPIFCASEVIRFLQDSPEGER